MVGITIERGVFWLALIAFIVPLTISTTFLAIETGLHIGIYYPTQEENPLRAGPVLRGTVFVLALAVVQLLSLLLRRMTVAGNPRRRRCTFAYAGLLLACLTELARTRPSVFPISVVVAGSATALLLLVCAAADRRVLAG